MCRNTPTHFLLLFSHIKAFLGELYARIRTFHFDTNTETEQQESHNLAKKLFYSTLCSSLWYWSTFQQSSQQRGSHVCSFLLSPRGQSCVVLSFCFFRVHTGCWGKFMLGKLGWQPCVSVRDDKPATVLRLWAKALQTHAEFNSLHWEKTAFIFIYKALSCWPTLSTYCIKHRMRAESSAL